MARRQGRTTGVSSRRKAGWGRKPGGASPGARRSVRRAGVILERGCIPLNKGPSTELSRSIDDRSSSDPGWIDRETAWITCDPLRIGWRPRRMARCSARIYHDLERISVEFAMIRLHSGRIALDTYGIESEPGGIASDPVDRERKIRFFFLALACLGRGERAERQPDDRLPGRASARA